MAGQGPEIQEVEPGREHQGRGVQEILHSEECMLHRGRAVDTWGMQTKDWVVVVVVAVVVAVGLEVREGLRL